MIMKGHVKYIEQRLSLRTPQNEALKSLAKFLDLIQLSAKKIELESIQREFPRLKDFERDFPNVCFSLATGVGKTRLMGACITYLFLAKRVRNFLVLSPNNTILEKLIKDFKDSTYEKYVFKGISEFANKPPKIITGEDYEQGAGVRNDRAIQPDMLVDDEEVHINIFNIAKLHADKRKIKQKNDYLDVSYFDYLASLEDLVILMDEAHRYRAEAAMKTIRDLKPLLGLEFTATPQIEKTKETIRFKNILYDYPLDRAIKDGYLKVPAIAGRENFNLKNYASEDELEYVKIRDGVILHEQTKLHLLSFAAQEGKKPLKPLMLIVAQDTKHADKIKEHIQKEEFFKGKYRNKVLVVHSAIEAEAEEQMIRDLLQVENSDNPIEIIIHVNMLREGWDIINLYTMVPLRKANSKTLIEQNLGRGLRLPFGKRTGIKEIDTHTVVSHDRFDEIINEVRSGNSPISEVITIGKDRPEGPMEAKEVKPTINTLIEVNPANNQKANITSKILKVINETGLNNKEEIIKYLKKEIPEEKKEEYENVIEFILHSYKENLIYVPLLTRQPKIVQKGKFFPFKLDLQQISLKPYEEGLIIENLITGERWTCSTKDKTVLKQDPFHTLQMFLLDLDPIADNEENYLVVEDLARQVILHLKGYLNNDDLVSQLIRQSGKNLAKIIYHQMQEHYEEPVIDIDFQKAERSIPLKTKYFLVPFGQHSWPFYKPVEDKLHIRKLVFEGFKKCLYPLAKFDSDSERIFSNILEQDHNVKKWIRLQRGDFPFISYCKEGFYEPDFIVETEDKKFVCEIKNSKELTFPEVLAKAEAAADWCKMASKCALELKSKPWNYLLIPHDVINLTCTFASMYNYIYVNRNKKND